MGNSISHFRSRYSDLIDRFVKWANDQPDILAIINQGSQARLDHPADEWSDLDLIVYTTNTEKYLGRPDWLENLGPVILTFLEETAVGGQLERRALFQGGLDVDFSIISKDQMMKDVASPSPEDQDMIKRGVKVLHDKTGILTKLPTPSKTRVASKHAPPSNGEFEQVVNDFLYHVMWTAKKWRRGELWTAKACCDSYLKRKLLRMIEWNTLAAEGWDRDIWFNGRYLEEWADPEIVKALGATFAHYDHSDVKRALLATTELFLDLAADTSTKLGYKNLDSQVEPVTTLAKSYLDEGS